MSSRSPQSARRASRHRNVVALPPANLADAVYRSLKDDIGEFRLLPGDRFSETEISARVGASRTPVRHALYRLQRDGLVDVHFRSGWEVRPLDFERFDALYELRIILETAAVERLCRADARVHRTLAPLKDIWLVRPDERLDDGARVAALDEQFHASLVRAGGNGEVLRVHQDVTDRIRIIRRLDFSQPARIRITYDEHAAILRAVLGRRTEDAGRLVRTHIEASRSEVRKITIHMLQAARRPW